MKILITGSSGTIGTRLFERLLDRNYDVLGFDKEPNEWDERLDKLTIKGDLTKDIKKLPKDFDLIIHLAANARVYKLVLNPDLALENILTTYNILKFTLRNKIKKFIYASSREVYGNKKGIVSNEDDISVKRCECPYTASKISGEALVQGFSNSYGIDYLILRFSNVYGMYDKKDRFMPLNIQKMRRGKDVYIYGRDKVLDFTYIDDCVDGIIRTIERFNKVKNNTFNIASGKGEKLTKVAELMKEAIKSKSKIIVKPAQTGEVIKYTADISRAKRLLGYKPKYPIKKGISETIAWYYEKI